MLDTLPVELVELLLGYLCLSDRLQMSMVSKRMYNVFWRSPIGANLRKGIVFRIDRMKHVEDLVGSRIFRLSGVNEVVLVFERIADPDMDRFLDKWDQLAPQIISLTMEQFHPMDVFRLLKNCSRLVHLTWMYEPYEEQYLDLPPVSFGPEGPVAVRLASVKHLELNIEVPKSMLSEFVDDFLCTSAVSALVTLTLKPAVDFKVLLRHVTLHAASLKNLNIPDSDITGQQLLSLGSIPNLKLLQLNLSNCRSISQNSFAQFLRLQPQLISLDIYGCEDVIFADESWDSIKTEFCSNLSGLESLVISARSDPKFGDYIPKLTKLRHLSVWPTFRHEPLAVSLNKSSCRLLKAGIGHNDVPLLHESHLRNLRELTLSHSCGAEDNPNEVYARIWQHCPNLEALVIFALAFEADSPVRVSCNNLRKLTKLSISLWMPSGWTDSVAELLQLPNMRRLAISSRTNLYSNDMLQFSRHLADRAPLLESLVVSNVLKGQISKVDAIRYAQFWPRMKAVKFNYSIAP